jgi:hypothetical protein
MGNHQTRPYHGKRESTIVFGAYHPWVCCCCLGQRLAVGDPLVCSTAEYRDIATAAKLMGLGKRSYWEAHCVGIPVFGHNLDLPAIAEALCQEFPTKHIHVEDSYEGCDNCGQWEFIVRIRPKEESAPARTMAMRKG